MWGADAVLDLDATPDVNHRIAWVREHTDGRGADIVFQCATSAVVAEGLEMARPGGRLVSIGVGGGPVTLSPMIFFKQVRINGVAMAEARHFYQAIDFLATRRRQFTFDRIISGTYTLDNATEALRKMAAFQEVKPLILPRVSS